MFPSQDGANDGSFRKLQFLDGPADRRRSFPHKYLDGMAGIRVEHGSDQSFLVTDRMIEDLCSDIYEPGHIRWAVNPCDYPLNSKLLQNCFHNM